MESNWIDLKFISPYRSTSLQPIEKHLLTVCLGQARFRCRGVYFRKFDSILFAGLSLLGTKSGQNTAKDWSEHKINAIFELGTLENSYIEFFFGLIYEL